MSRQVSSKGRRDEFIRILRAMGPGDECVAWPWSDNHDGYTNIRVDGRIYRAHRWVYEQIHGVELPHDSVGPGDQVVMHTCDHPWCVRHLVLGSPKDNIRDAASKGRLKSRVGDGIHAKVSLDEVGRIRRLVARGVSRSVLAEEYGVSVSTIGDIATGRSRSGTPHEKLTDEDRATIKRLAARPEIKQHQIALEYGVSDATISHIVRGKTPGGRPR